MSTKEIAFEEQLFGKTTMGAIPSDNWRSVNTAPINEDVLVFDKNYGRVTASFDGRIWFMQSDEFEIPMSLVTHWQPLPDPPVEV